MGERTLKYVEATLLVDEDKAAKILQHFRTTASMTLLDCIAGMVNQQIEEVGAVKITAKDLRRLESRCGVERIRTSKELLEAIDKLCRTSDQTVLVELDRGSDSGIFEFAEANKMTLGEVVHHYLSFYRLQEFTTEPLSLIALYLAPESLRRLKAELGTETIRDGEQLLALVRQVKAVASVAASSEAGPGGGLSEEATEKWARLFHETYERLAPQFGYETRKETKQFDPNSANGRLMIAVCNEIIQAAVARGREPETEDTCTPVLAQPERQRSETEA